MQGKSHISQITGIPCKTGHIKRYDATNEVLNIKNIENLCVITSFFGAVSLKIKYMCRIEETNEGGFTVFIDNKYMIVRRFEEYMDVMISKNTV